MRYHIAYHGACHYQVITRLASGPVGGWNPAVDLGARRWAADEPAVSSERLPGNAECALLYRHTHRATDAGSVRDRVAHCRGDHPLGAFVRHPHGLEQGASTVRGGDD